MQKWIENELATADFGDVRLKKRAADSRASGGLAGAGHNGAGLHGARGDGGVGAVELG